MDIQNNTVEHFIMLVLNKFVSKQLLDCNLSFVDDIIVDYMVSVLEDLGDECTELETTFHFEDFIEMMSAYIPGFDQINSNIVTEWIFNVAAKIRSGKWVEESIAVQNEEKDENNNVSSSHLQCNAIASNHLFSSSVNKSSSCNVMSGDHWYTSPIVSASVLFPENNATGNLLFPLDITQNILFPPINTAQTIIFPQEGTSQGDMVSNKENNDCKIPELMSSVDVSKCKHIKKEKNRIYDLDTVHFPSLNCNTIDDNLDSSETHNYIDDVESTKMKHSEKVGYLSEMFPDIPEGQLKRCLSRARSNLEKAVAIILASRNDGTKKVVNKKEDDELAAVCDEGLEKVEKDIAKLMEMFPRLSECRIRDRYNVVGNNSERAIRVILSEEENRAHSFLGKKFQVHKTSFKKIGLSEQDREKIKKETIYKYSYVVDDEEKVHHPVVLVKKDATKQVSSLSEEDKCVDINSTVNNCTASTESKVGTKQGKSNNPKLNRKQRYR